MSTPDEEQKIKEAIDAFANFMREVKQVDEAQQQAMGALSNELGLHLLETPPKKTL